MQELIEGLAMAFEKVLVDSNVVCCWSNAKARHGLQRALAHNEHYARVQSVEIMSESYEK
jgi:hypothetical protein